MDDVIQHIDHIFVHNDLVAACLRSLVYRWNHLSILYFYGETTLLQYVLFSKFCICVGLISPVISNSVPAEFFISVFELCVVLVFNPF